ncbi:endopeptidase La [Vallitalea sp.]|jgi:ATP-dependent Lon protease|uniref:endopeptidase La n=1 Tax=Vallitalea sp. TaxID=1882829 RepID=UPI0025EB577B|nr:endopeptidase La [Vallitalea sp.]MCT4685879.1 endopeptidase La [Vallitalea sp.]
MEETTIKLPLLALRGINVLPDMIIHFDVNRKKSVNALEEAMTNEQLVFLVAQKDAKEEEPLVDNLYKFGSISKIKQLIKLPGNIIRVLVEGLDRGEIKNIISEEPFIMANVEKIGKTKAEISEEEKEALLRITFESLEEYSKVNPQYSIETIKNMLGIRNIGKLADSIASNINISLEDKQKILGEIDPAQRLKMTMSILKSEIELSKIKKDIQIQVKQKIDKNQKEYYLREQLKVIQNELGDKYGLGEEVEKYKKQLKKLKAPKNVKEKVEKEIDRMKKIPNGSSEGVVVRNYIECLLELPWNKKTKESKNITKAEDILNKDHYGLEKVKERILEHLAVRKLSAKTDSPILCLVGPPGTGKTSIAKSIAKALNRNYVRISLGGVRDEAEIRGHRRTYIGAMPGRIVNGLKQSGSSNALMLFDEIDKMSSDFRGDPSSALLEVLDSEQNNKFRDHYIQLPVDLSDVLFIATANSVQTIPRPLLDRLELIEVTSYTANEKMHIASRHLIMKQMEKHGLKEEQLSISKNALKTLISSYTKEAGVRNLERRIGEICRKAAKEVLVNNKPSIKITDQNIEKYLGIPLYTFDRIADKSLIGVVRGLAWTAVGGDTLSIEVNTMKGTGKFELTGQLGDVMKESARAGISYIRSKTNELKIDKDFYKNTDIHIHIPEGAVRKDGPSAGITMATAMISALTNKPVKNDVAMTGEITLRGRVLPIGGLKEKLLAAKRAGIKKVLIPKDNMKNISEVDKEITKGLEVIYVTNMNEVIDEAIINTN